MREGSVRFGSFRGFSRCGSRSRFGFGSESRDAGRRPLVQNHRHRHGRRRRRSTSTARSDRRPAIHPVRSSSPIVLGKDHPPWISSSPTPGAYPRSSGNRGMVIRVYREVSRLHRPSSAVIVVIFGWSRDGSHRKGIGSSSLESRLGWEFSSLILVPWRLPLSSHRRW